MAVARDYCVVDSEPLAELLNGFVRRWNERRPPARDGGRFAAGGGRTTEVSFVRATAWLAQESGVREHVIQKVVQGRTRTTELRVADPLVMAIERPDAFRDGTLTIRPNPRASRDARARCCNGSGE